MGGMVRTALDAGAEADGASVPEGDADAADAGPPRTRDATTSPATTASTTTPITTPM